jgi:tetratricopeptide (TPR) repeat protein
MSRLCLIVAVALLAACTGPTKQGKLARASAHQRMDAVNADLAAQQAMQQFEVGQLDAALETINSAVARYDDNASYHLLRGRILIEQHQLDAACKALARSVEIDSKVAEPHYFLGVLHQRWSEDEQALICYQKAMDCSPTHPQFLLATAETLVALGQLDDAIALLERAGKEFQHQPSVTALLGHIHLRNGNPAEAAKFLADSRLLGNDDAEVLTLLATAQFNAGDYANCLNTIAQLEESEKLSPTFQRLKGKCLSATGREIQGRDICLQVTRQTPDDAGAWVDLGFIAWQMGDYARVAKCGKKIRELAPELSEGPLFEGVVAMRLGDEEKGRELLAAARSDNCAEGIDSLLQMYTKSAKLKAKRAIVPNTAAKTVEGGNEQHPEKLAEGSQPIVGVTQDFPLAP